MDHFLDTGVFVGYVFRHDHWHQASCNCLSMESAKYTSTNVSAEFSNVVSKIRDEFRDELLIIIDRLHRKNQGDFVSHTDLGWLVMMGSKSRIARFLNWLATQLKQERLTFGQLVNRLRDAERNYMADTLTQEAAIKKRIGPKDVVCWMRRVTYPTLKNQISGQVGDLDDVDILLDAHDLAANKNLKSLEFITGDKEHIKDNEDLILKNLRIARIRYLLDFLPS